MKLWHFNKYVGETTDNRKSSLSFGSNTGLVIMAVIAILVLYKVLGAIFGFQIGSIIIDILVLGVMLYVIITGLSYAIDKIKNKNYFFGILSLIGTILLALLLIGPVIIIGFLKLLQ